MVGFKFLLTGFFLLPLAANGFNYDNTLKWNADVPQCSGLKQSPIDLDLRQSSPLVIHPIVFMNFEAPLVNPVVVENNGHSIEMGVDRTINGFKPFITGGGLNGVYEVIQIHFHWGSPQVKGSEHALGGQKYDLEMHIVMKNTRFVTAEQARNDPFGLAVMGVLFKSVDQSGLPRTGLNQILDLLPSLRYPGLKKSIVDPITIGSLMGTLDPKKFYTYRGSLTTPPCSQAVTWIVFEDILPIETPLLQEFWKLIDPRGLPLVNNFRPLQSQNRRRVFSRKFLR